MTTTIQLLDERTINQIAAGEVIEDSASCIKELVENALDAGATTISIETMGGGVAQIRVSDNGQGMSPADMELAILRNATSKIKRADDLWSLNSLGFRGEALASITAVAKVQMISCLAEQEIAHQVEFERGKVIAKKRTSRKPGTTITVHSLFYNAPARLRFQKSIAAQTKKVGAVLRELALFADGVGFSWKNEGKIIFSIAPHTTLAERIALLLGENFASELMPLDYFSAPYRLTGYMGKLLSHRPNRLHQHLFINGRKADSKRISTAVARAYDRRIPEGRFAPFVCNFILPKESVDVNVHPQKKEVRFKEGLQIEPFFSKAINSLFVQKEAPKVPLSLPTFTMPTSPKRSVLEKKEEPKKAPPSLHILRLVGSCALVEVEELYLLHLPRASQFLFEASLKKQKGALPSQKLLLPLAYHCSLKEAECIENHVELLASFGFSLRPFGKGTFAIESIHPHFDKERTQAFLDALSGTLTKKNIMTQLLQKVQRASYTVEQARAVATTLFSHRGPYCLTNGKAVTFALNHETLQKIFK